MFCMLAYTPKATVQAAIGGIPLSLGFACGDMVLTVAVLAIVLTAPLGALAIDSLYKKMAGKVEAHIPSPFPLSFHKIRRRKKE